MIKQDSLEEVGLRRESSICIGIEIAREETRGVGEDKRGTW